MLGWERESTGRFDNQAWFRHDFGRLLGPDLRLASVYVRHEPLLTRARCGRSEFAKFNVDDIKSERGPSG